MVGQLGLSLITPVLLAAAGAYLIIDKTGAGVWIYIPAFILGLGASFMTAYKLYTSETDRTGKTNSENCTKSKRKNGFNDHI